MQKRILLIVLVLVLSSVVLSACAWPAGEAEDGPLTVAGNIEAREVQVGPELSGRVVEVLVDEGQAVEAGDVLLRLDDEVLRAQRDQAAAAVDTAAATVAAAQAQLQAAQLQQELAVQGARMLEQPARAVTWQAAVPPEFTLPAWYLSKTEAISAARGELAAAEEALQVEWAGLEDTRRKVSNADFVATEERLAGAQATFLIAQLTLDQAGVDEANLREIAQQQYDAALADLEAAQLAYDRILSSTSAQDLLEARARAAVAWARRENAADRLATLLTGADSLQVEAAGAAVRQAEAALAQAEAQLSQAQAAQRLLDVQLAKAEVLAPVSGTVLARNVEAGEIVAAGSALLVLGQLDEVTLLVYIPETRYGQVQLGQAAEVTVDSFPGQTFAGTVVRIADQAEFTPRNVQTADGRRSTVYAAEIAVANAGQKLKPGMPADVVLEP